MSKRLRFADALAMVASNSVGAGLLGLFAGGHIGAVVGMAVGVVISVPMIRGSR